MLFFSLAALAFFLFYSAPIWSSSGGSLGSCAATSPFDALLSCEQPSSLSGERAALRASTRLCDDWSYFDGLVSAPPLRACSSAELSAALSAATRTGRVLTIPGCRLQWYLGERACALLAAAGGLHMRGDSLTRHLLQAVRAALLGLPPRAFSKHMDAFWQSRYPGEVPRDMDALCDCDAAFNDGHGPLPPGQSAAHRGVCRAASLAHLSLAQLRASWPRFCAAWGERDMLPPWDEIWPVAPADPPARYVSLQGGLHAPGGALGAAAAERTFGAALRRGDANATRFIFLTQHAPGSGKSAQFMPAQGPAATRAYNALVRAEAAAAGAALFDAHALSEGAESIDGTHYDADFNVVAAQLLLNLLAALQAEKKRR